jgi:hypothetical protein
VQGELDWIVMKALDKDRARRYETASAFATDVQRYLSDEPVQACPPSAGYRLRKFARRNRAAVLAVAASFLLLIAGISGTSWGLVRAEQAWQAEVGQRKLAEAAVLAERAAQQAEAEQRGRAEEACKKAAREAAIAAAVTDFLNKDLLQLAGPLGQINGGVAPDPNLKLRTVIQRAAKRIDGRFPNEPEVEMRLRHTIGYALCSAGDFAAALAQFEKVVAYSQELQGRDHAFTLLAEYRVGVMHKHLRHFDVAVTLLEENVERHITILGQGNVHTLLAMNGLAIAYQAAGQKEKALQLAEQTLELRKRHLGATHADTLTSMGNVGWLYLQRMQTDKALPLLEEALAGMRAKFPPLHPERMVATQSLAQAYHAAEQLDKALTMQETVTGQYKTAYGVEDRATQSCIDNLIRYSVEMGTCGKAELLLKSIQIADDNLSSSAKQRQEQREKGHRELIERIRPTADKYQQELAAKNAEHPDTLAARQAFAVALRGQKRNSAAAYHLKAVLEARQRSLPADHPDIQTSRLDLGTTRLQQKRYAEAEQFLLEAYAALKQHETNFPESKSLATEALRRLVQLYDSSDKKDQAAEWRTKLEEQKK